MFRKIYDILSSFLGESKQGGYDSTVAQYAFNCPSCAEMKGVDCDNKYNLEVNLLLGKYHCWSCGEINNMKGNISSLIKKYGNATLLKEYKDEISNIKSNSLYKIDDLENESNITDETFVSLPKSYRKINLKTCRNNKLISYLNKRKINQNVIDYYNIGYTIWDDEEKNISGRIIIPSYDSNGFLNYWVGRDFTGYERRIKYRNDQSDKKNIIFNEKNIKWDGDIILVEGPFDMLGLSCCTHNIIPLLGKSISKDSTLFQTLYKKSNGKIIIFLDGDARDDTKKIYSTLNIGRLKNRIWYVPIREDLDPSDLYKLYGLNGVISALRSIKQFKEIELMF